MKIFKPSKNGKMSSLVLKRRSAALVVGIIRTLFIIGLCYLFLFPVCYMIVTALQDPAYANDPSSIWIPKKLSMVAIKGAMEALNFWPSLGITTRISIFSTIASLLSCSLAGYGIARFKLPGKKIVMAILFLTILVPPQLLLTAQYVNFRYFDFGGLLGIFGADVNILDSELSFVLPAIFANGLRGGLFIFIFKQFFEGLPKDLEEAGKIDGSGTFRTFFSIMLPLAVPAFITVLLFSFIWHWNDYYSAAVYFSGDVRPLTVMLNGLQAALEQGSAIASDATAMESRMYLQAGALLTVLPPLVIYVFTQKYFTEGIERTGIVG
ncbi:MAG: carbohydrate ABC transporter permease [Clostridia bacterium]|nr:carbohydrate ABC transporter permease [Clostridia bacterium]